MRKAYLDTNIISALAKRDLPEDDQAAVHGLMDQVRSSNLTVCASTEVRGELEGVPVEHRQPHMDVYDDIATLQASTQWLDHTGTFHGQASETFGQLKRILPDEMDARHITHAAMHDVRDFVTADARTILRYRAEIEEASGVAVWSPGDYLEDLI